MLVLKLNHVSKRGHWYSLTPKEKALCITSPVIGWVHIQNDPWNAWQLNISSFSTTKPFISWNIFRKFRKILIYLHFLSFLNVGMVQIFQIVPHGWNGLTYPTYARKQANNKPGIKLHHLEYLWCQNQKFKWIQSITCDRKITPRP